tara:strand:- start:8604 stop:9512 length:909 start_codon:yes stop_codon:yes gene_type:complete
MKLNIDKPCNENWSSMKIGMISRHCKACEKDVFDFTKKTNEEILNFLIQNQNGSICGRIKKSQLDFHHKELEVIINGLRKQKNNKYVFAILSLACLALVSCNEPVSDNTIVTSTNHFDKVLVAQVDSNTSDNQKRQINEAVNTPIDSLKEKPVCEIQKNSSKQNNDSIVSDIEVPDFDIMGFMIMEHDITKDIDSNAVHTLVEKMPEFIGGIDSLFSFLGKNLVYPEIEKSSNIQGKVYVIFVIDRDGSVIEPKILRGLSNNCDREVIRVMNIMPKWEAGEHRGKKVKVSYNLPINFSLKDK